MRTRRIYISIVLSILALHASAQNTKTSKDTTIKGSTIEIMQAYKPEVKQMQKPEMVPTLAPTDTTHPKFNYVVPQQSLLYTYSSPALRPLALGKDTAGKKLQNYVKAGAGNLSTIFLDAGLSKLTWKDYEAALHLHYLSQDGSIQYQQVSLAGLEADGNLHRDGNNWHAFLDASRNQYHYYGYDHDIYNPPSDSLTQTFTGIHIGLDMQNEKPGYMGLNYHPAVFASLFKDAFKASETTLGFAVPVSKDIDSSLQVLAAINATFTQFSGPSQSTGNNIFQIAPGVNYHKDLWSIHATLSPTFGKDNVFFLPDIVGYYHLSQYGYLASAGWQSTLQQNSYEQLSAENPYMFNTYTIHQTHRDEVFADLKGSFGNHISFSGRLSWWQYGNLPLFINNLGDQKQFNVIYYEKVNAVSLQAAGRYDVGNTLSLGLSLAYFNFSSGSGKVWGQAPLRIKSDLSFRPINELICTAYMSVLGGTQALNASQQAVTLPTALDIGGNAEYFIIPRLSLFLQINNILNNKYQLWQGYQAYGLNFYGGLRLKF